MRALEAAEAARAAAAAAEIKARARWREAQQLADTAREEHAAAEREISRNAARVSALQEAQQRTCRRSRRSTVAARAEAENALTALPPAAEIEDQSSPQVNEDRRKRSRGARRGARRSTDDRARRRARQPSPAGDRRRSAEWNERKDKAAAQIDIIGAAHRRSNDRARELDQAPQKFAAQRQALIGEIETATAGAAPPPIGWRMAKPRSRQPTRPRGRRSKPSAKRAPKRRAPKSAATAPRRRLADVEHEIRDSFDVEPAAAAEIAELKPEEELPAIAEVEEKLDRIRRERERLGAVNLLAEQELHEVEAPAHQADRERDDLVEAIRRLRQGIDSLNQRSARAAARIVRDRERQLPETVHRAVRRRHRRTAADRKRGSARSRPGNLAKPPGKKTATLSLLSGGEQALTALALIFAVFLTNPAPICVLDEVDAPLDDYNVERFCDLLDEMTRSTDTRFVIITHNPITMARMNRLYGVTMAERGVSQLVSVDLEGAVKLREAS